MPTDNDDDNGGETLSGGDAAALDTNFTDTADAAEDRTDKPRARDRGPSATWWQRAVRRSDKQNEAADARSDAWAQKALTTAEAGNVFAWRVIKFQWLIIGLLTIAVIGLAGYNVGVDLPAMGAIQIGGSGAAKKVRVTPSTTPTAGEVELMPIEDESEDEPALEN